MRLLSVIFLLFLTSCVDVRNTGPASLPNFRQHQPIYMTVSGIKVIEEYQSPMRAPNVEHLMPYSPADVMQVWAKQRVKAVGIGSSNYMQIIIKDASVIEKELPTDQDFLGWFTSEINRQYNARLEVEMRIYGSDSAISKASINVTANRKITMSEDESVSERDAIFRAMLADMMVSMNAELEKNIFEYLGKYVDYSKNP